MDEIQKYGFLPHTSGIYFIQNRETLKVYIGSAFNIRKRVKRHFQNLRAGQHHSDKLSRSFKKHGEDAFEFGAVEVCSRDELKEREQFWIGFYDAFNRGYNCAEKVVLNELRNTDDFKRRVSEGIRKSYQNPERKLRHLLAVRKATSLPEYRDKTRARMIKMHAERPEAMRKGIEAMTAPDVQKRAHLKITETLRTPEKRKERREISQRFWSNSDNRAITIAKMKARFLDPSIKAKHLVQLKINRENGLKKRKGVDSIEKLDGKAEQQTRPARVDLPRS